MRLNQKGFSIFGILFKLLVLLLVYYLIVKLYFNIIFDPKTRKYLAAQGIDTVSVQGMLESVKHKVGEINQALARRADDTEKLFDQGRK